MIELLRALLYQVLVISSYDTLAQLEIACIQNKGFKTITVSLQSGALLTPAMLTADTSA